MGDPSLNLDLGSALPYLHQTLLQWLGKDEGSKHISKEIENHIRVSTKEIPNTEGVMQAVHASLEEP